MWLSSMLNSLSPSSTRARRRASPRQRPTARCRLEYLEDRSLPSTLTVLNTADSGAGSLRAAIAAAQSGDRIVFDPGLDGQTIMLTSGELAINQSLDIEGRGADKLTVSGNDSSRVFSVGSGVSVDIDDLTITHGRAANGGGIWNPGGTLTLSHDVIADNQALGAPGSRAQGGGVFNQGGTLTVEDTTFSANVVMGGTTLTGTNTTQGQGGGLASDLGATTTVSHSVFADNRAIGGDGAPGVMGSNGGGGGLWNRSGSVLTISHSTFSHNQGIGGAGGAGQAGGSGNGGGLQNNSSMLVGVDHSLLRTSP